MAYQFTPASQRVLDEASRWRSGSQNEALEPPEVLLGLLSEPECRAAAMLAAHGIDIQAVCARWPGLARGAGTGNCATAPEARYSVKLQDALAAAEVRLRDRVQPLTLATEHLLLGLAAAENEVSRWLAERGLGHEWVELEINRLYGFDTGPLEIDASIVASNESEPDDSQPIVRWESAGEFDADDEWLEQDADSILAIEPGLLRIIDAEGNRAREGLRVVEDYVRFVLDDGHLTGELKQLRHDLSAALGMLNGHEAWLCRDTPGDVGTEVSTSDEWVRHDAAKVAAINFQRLSESLRSLEEFVKVIHPQIGREFERIRYQAYTLHRAVESTRRSLERLDWARLYLIVDAEFLARTDVMEQVLDAGVDVVQLRDKTLSDSELLNTAGDLRQATREFGALLVINDRPDIAMAIGADGVHVGQEDLPMTQVRRIVGPGMFVGVSTHTIEQARSAVLSGADYIGVGPTFPSATKSFESFTGLELVSQVCGNIRLPAFAIGGIDLANIQQVLAAGMGRVAVSSAVCRAADPVAVVRELRCLLDQAE